MDDCRTDNVIIPLNRTADRLAAKREQWELQQLLRTERGEDETIDFGTDVGSIDVWTGRIADEVASTAAAEMLRNAKVFNRDEARKPYKT